jgi:hypothetical protein
MGNEGSREQRAESRDWTPEAVVVALNRMVKDLDKILDVR